MAVFFSKLSFSYCSNAYICKVKSSWTEDKNETRLYLLIWAGALLFFALRIIIECIIRHESAIDFGAILSSWVRMVPFLLLFVMHNSLAAPQLVYKKRTGLYAILTFVLLALFIAWITLGSDSPSPGMAPPEPPDWDPDLDGRNFPQEYGEWRPMSPQVLRALLGVMMVAANLGIKFFFRSESEKIEMARLEKENLQYRLETLRYQINPHFFMNTLNNIHALVDLDPEKAKESIVELSKLMRHVLYDSDKATIPLSQETDFVEHYISLMRLRFTDNVSIEFNRPESLEGAEVPPLSFASIVENAFKHGPSYEKPSFIRVSVSLDSGKIVFKCVNSRPPAASSGKGVGLANSRSRFDILYGSSYTLHIEETPDIYDVLLVLPSTPPRTL